MSDLDGQNAGALEVESLLAPSQRPLAAHKKLSGAKVMFKDAAFRQALKNLGYIAVWYFLSTLLTLYNKALLGHKRGLFGDAGFPAPLFMTGVQFFIQWGLTSMVLWASCCSPVKSSEPVSWYEWLTKVFPNAASTGLDIGLSNRSLAYITVSFYTMCKSTVPLWLLVFAFSFGVETPSWGLAGVVAAICIGLLLLVAGETQFHLMGFIMVMTAAMLSGLRWTITQIQLQPPKHASGTGEPNSGRATSDAHQEESDKGRGKGVDAVAVMHQLYPIMSATVLLMSLVSERLWVILPDSSYFATGSHSIITVLCIVAGAAIAFLMVWAEFKVIQETSAITFMVAGTCKEVITVISSVLIFGDEFHLVNGMGLVVLLSGVAMFNYIKLKKVKSGKARTQPIQRRQSAGNNGGAAEENGILISGDGLEPFGLSGRNPSPAVNSP